MSQIPENVLELLPESVKLVWREKLIVAPYLIFLLLFQLSEPFLHVTLDLEGFQEHSLLYLVLVAWVGEVSVKSICLFLANSTFRGISIQSDSVVAFLFRRLPVILIGTGVIAFPLFWCVKQMAGMMTDTPELSVSMLVFFPVLILSFFMEFLPISMIVKNASAWASFRELGPLFLRHFKSLFFFMVIMVFNGLGVVLLSFLFQSMPGIGQSILYPVVQGIGYTVLSVMSFLFYVMVSSRSERLGVEAMALDPSSSDNPPEDEQQSKELRS